MGLCAGVDTSKFRNKLPMESAREKGSDILHLRGLAFLRAGDFDGAIDLISRSVLLNPENPFAHNNRGIALRSAGRLAEARLAFENALVLKPDYVQARYNSAVTLHDAGHADEALRAYLKVLELSEEHVEAHFGRAELLFERGDNEEAAMHLGACVLHDPSDTLGARLLLASIEHGKPPPRASNAQLAHLYARRAMNWDSNPAYRAHRLVADEFCAATSGNGSCVLDAGCGTGLVGTLIRSRSLRLEGIDMSEAMLKHAAEKNIYDAVYHGDMLSLMDARKGYYDAVLSAAVLIHFGDLGAVLSTVFSCLKPGGRFIFTLYSNDSVNAETFVVGPAQGLVKGGCYSHGSAYVTRAASKSAFIVQSIRTEIHEQNAAGSLSALLVSLVKNDN